MLLRKKRRNKTNGKQEPTQVYLKNKLRRGYVLVAVFKHVLQTLGDAPATLSVADVVLAETAGHVYRLLHGLERCCSLDTPSCVLSGLVVYDRLCRRHQGDEQQRDEGQKTVIDSVVDPQTTASEICVQIVTDPGLCLIY